MWALWPCNYAVQSEHQGCEQRQKGAVRLFAVAMASRDGCNLQLCVVVILPYPVVSMQIKFCCSQDVWLWIVFDRALTCFLNLFCGYTSELRRVDGWRMKFMPATSFGAGKLCVLGMCKVLGVGIKNTNLSFWFGPWRMILSSILNISTCCMIGLRGFGRGGNAVRIFVGYEWRTVWKADTRNHNVHFIVGMR